MSTHFHSRLLEIWCMWERVNPAVPPCEILCDYRRVYVMEIMQGTFYIDMPWLLIGFIFYGKFYTPPVFVLTIGCQVRVSGTYLPGMTLKGSSDTKSKSLV